MSEPKASHAGTVVWHDLTVKDARRVRDFYAAVVGWRVESVDMVGYSDFNMLPRENDQPVAGVCHARGVNAALPPQWLMYVVVDDLAAALERCAAQGGAVVDGPRGVGEQTIAVIRDPAGAHVALLERP